MLPERGVRLRHHIYVANHKSGVFNCSGSKCHRHPVVLEGVDGRRQDRGVSFAVPCQPVVVNYCDVISEFVELATQSLHSVGFFDA